MGFKVLSWLRNIAGCIRRYPLQALLLLAVGGACYCYVCPYFTGVLGIAALVWAGKNKAA